MSSEDRPKAAPRAFPAETAQARCPRCGAAFGAEATAIVDAANARDREALLAGRLNAAGCPSCGQPILVEAPQLYFDADEEVALAYVPDGLTTSREEQERAVGRLTNRVLDALPPEQRKMYLLQPRMFFSRQSYMEAVLEANGVSRQDIDRARAAATFVEDLARLPDRESVRRRLEDEGRLDDPSLAPIAEAMAQDAAAAGDAARAARYRDLAAQLHEIGGKPQVTLDDLVAALTEAAEQDDLASAVAALRPVLDYAFFTALSARIDAASTDERNRLTTLRRDILAAIDEHDARVSAELERAMDTLRAVLEAPDATEAVRKRAPALDSAFFSVLQANIQAAEERGSAADAERLSAIREAALDGVEAAMSPRQRLVNRLARTTDPEARQQLLDTAEGIGDAQTEATLRRAASDAAAMGADDVAQRLHQAAEEIARRRPEEGGAAS